MTYHLFRGRVVVNTFEFPLFGKDFLRVKGKWTLVFDLGYFSLAFVLKRA